MPPALKCTHGGAQEGVPPRGRVRRGAASCPHIVVHVWLLCGHKLHQFVSFGESQRPRTAAPQLCTLWEHAVLTNLVKGGSARLRGGAHEWAWFRGCSPGGADPGAHSTGSQQTQVRWKVDKSSSQKFSS